MLLINSISHVWKEPPTSFLSLAISTATFYQDHFLKQHWHWSWCFRVLMASTWSLVMFFFFKCFHNFFLCLDGTPGRGGVLPYLEMVGRFRRDDPRFGDFNPIGSLFYTSSQSDWPLSAEKIGLSLSHLVPEILGPKIDLIIYKKVLFNRF